jgi:sporulation protein YtfJ
MENDYPIEHLLETSIKNIKQIIDVNTIIGTPVKVNENISIIPISKINTGFAAGGSEFKNILPSTQDTSKNYASSSSSGVRYPFGGGAGTYANIVPVAFLIVQNNSVRLLSIENSSSVDKLVDYVPEAFDKLSSLFKNGLKKNPSR